MQQQSPNQSQQEDHKTSDLMALPHLVPISLFPANFKVNDMPQTLGEPLVQMHFAFNTMFRNFDPMVSKDFKFTFPASVFPKSKIRPQIESYQKLSIEEDTFSSKLTPSQIRQISKDGTFTVGSKKSALNYKWKIHTIIFKGWKNRQDDWYVNLSRAYHQFRQMGKRLNGGTLSVKLNLSELINYPGRMANMLVGLKQMTVRTNPNYDYILEIEFLNNKFDKFYKRTSHELYQYLYCPLKVKKGIESTQAKTQGRRAALSKIDREFDAEWVQTQRDMAIDYENKNTTLDQDYFNSVLLDKKNKEYHRHLKEKLDKQIADNVFQLLKMFTIFQTLKQKLSDGIQKARLNFDDRLKKEHKIRSKSYYFVQEETERQFKPIEDALVREYQENLRSSLKSEIYEQYIQHVKTRASRKQSLMKKIPVIYQPRRTFRSSYPLFPPYKIQTREDYRGKVYCLKREVETQTSTDHHFWKLSLYKMRIQTWTRTCLFYVVALAWVGPLGFKQLTTIGQYIYDQRIDGRYGEITYIKRKSLYLQFMTVMKGISDSRAAFEALPDTGFFGKNISRILNYIQCYLFRFLFVGVICLLILKPIAIIIYCVLSLASLLTIWIWVPLTLVATYLFNVLIYQFEIDDREFYNNRRFSQRIIPLLNTPLMLILNLVRVAVYTVAMLVVHPIGVLFWMAFSCIARAYRTISDFVMINIFRVLARTPARDTAVAWKISGPGVCQNYYRSMQQQDVYMLIQAELEKIYLDRFQKQVLAAIQKPIVDITKTVSKVLGTFDCSFNCPDRVSSVNNKLSNLFGAQKSKFQVRFPSLQTTNVKFTASQLDGYFANSLKLITHFVQSKNAKWIFELHSCKQDDYQRLGKCLWKSALGNDILQPLEAHDNRFELQSVKRDNDIRGVVMRALQGIVKLNKITPSVTKDYTQFNSGVSIPIVRLQGVLQNISAISGNSFPNSISEDIYSILFNRNIKQVIHNDRFEKKYDRLYQQGEPVSPPK